MECLKHHTLTAECGVAVYMYAHAFSAIFVTLVKLFSISFTLHNWTSSLQMAGISHNGDLDGLIINAINTLKAET